MKLYHGTTEAVARAALIEGLLPRAETGDDEGNWEDCPSNPELVYLTVAYAGYFAMAAAKDGERWAIIEIDSDLLDPNALLPDEDWLEQESRGQDLAEVFDDFPEGDGEAMTERTEWFRENIRAFRHLWDKSVERLGNCAHDGPIPPEAITRISLFDPNSNRFVAMAIIDPAICIMNYMLCGAKYRAVTAWLMGDDVPAERMWSLGFDPETVGNEELLAQIRKAMGDQIGRIEEELGQRDGLELLTSEPV